MRSPFVMTLTDLLQGSMEGLFPEVLGIRFLSASKDEIRAEMEVSRAMCTLPGRMHGGALMAFADTLGACGTALNLDSGDGTSTIESKTNFFAPGIEGSSVVGTARPLHRGRSTMVWQTRIEREEGRLVAVVTQTQIVLPRAKEPGEQLEALFADRAPSEQKALLATLERSGGNLYRVWAEQEPDAERRAALSRAAEREDENAALLESFARDDALS